jgi:hypothetical protein
MLRAAPSSSEIALSVTGGRDGAPGDRADPNGHPARPTGVTLLAVFFLAGAAISLASAVSLASPGGVLEPMWRVNPRARDSLARLGPLAPALLGAVSALCAFAGAGMLRRRAWGRALAIGLIASNLAGDLANGLAGIEPRALAGVPVAAAILLYLFRRRVRRYFGAGSPTASVDGLSTGGSS